ncbi:MAG: hypothetical protein CMD28_01060 [Flavobacteriales bacterium]|nr:hypothetical protein [Flavobacteriales bacterium]
MLILIPPSEGKSSKNTTEIKFNETNFVFSGQVKEIIQILKSKNEEIEKIYGTSIEKSKGLQEKNLNVFSNPCSKAIERYTGVVYNQLDLNNYSEESKKYFNSNIRIFSGLFGMVKPNTLIPDYKLKMNVLGLTKFWSPFLSKELAKEELIIDLLPEIHRKAYEHKNIKKISFYTKKSDKLVSAGHHGKVVKGQFINFLTLNCITKLDDFEKFEYDDYSWDGENFIK